MKNGLIMRILLTLSMNNSMFGSSSISVCVKGSISSNLSAQYKVQMHWSTAAQQVRQFFFYWWFQCRVGLLGSACLNAVRKNVDKIDPRIRRKQNWVSRHWGARRLRGTLFVFLFLLFLVQPSILWPVDLVLPLGYMFLHKLTWT